MEKQITQLTNLSNHQIQDILEELGMLDDNGYCPYTAEEIFKAGMRYAHKNHIEKKIKCHESN